MEQQTEAFVGIDAAKTRNAVAVAEGGRGGEVRYLGEVDAAEPGMRRLVGKRRRAVAAPPAARSGQGGRGGDPSRPSGAWRGC